MPTLTDQTCWDVLTTALEGGYAHEFEVVDFNRSEENGYVILSAILKCDEHGIANDDGTVTDTWAVAAPLLREGFRRYDAWVAEHDPAHRSYLGEQWAIAHDPDDTGWDTLDAIGADAVLQFACFGEVIFG